MVTKTFLLVWESRYPKNDDPPEIIVFFLMLSQYISQALSSQNTKVPREGSSGQTKNPEFLWELFTFLKTEEALVSQTTKNIIMPLISWESWTGIATDQTKTGSN